MTRRDIDDLELWLAFPVTLLIGSVVFAYLFEWLRIGY